MISLRSVVILFCLALVIRPVMACPYDFDQYPHLVNINVIGVSTDDYGLRWHDPSSNATITATGIQTEAPDWFWSLLGAKPTETNIDLTERNGTTDENGTATLQLYDAMLYNVTIVCDTGKASAFKIYPHESEYTIFVDC